MGMNSTLITGVWKDCYLNVHWPLADWVMSLVNTREWNFRKLRFPCLTETYWAAVLCRKVQSVMFWETCLSSAHSKEWFCECSDWWSLAVWGELYSSNWMPSCKVWQTPVYSPSTREGNPWCTVLERRDRQRATKTSRLGTAAALKSMKYDPGPFMTSVLELKLDATTTFEWQKHSQTQRKVPHY